MSNSNNTCNGAPTCLCGCEAGHCTCKQMEFKDMWDTIMVFVDIAPIGPKGSALFSYVDNLLQFPFAIKEFTDRYGMEIELSTILANNAPTSEKYQDAKLRLDALDMADKVRAQQKEILRNADTKVSITTVVQKLNSLFLRLERAGYIDVKIEGKALTDGFEAILKIENIIDEVNKRCICEPCGVPTDKPGPSPLINVDNGPVTSPVISDPLSLDLNNDGRIGTIHVNDSNMFLDVDNDKMAELVGWVSSEDGVVIHDKNKNGRLDGISELFGASGPNGFEELAEYDANKDGVIDANDEIYHNLQVWQDLNQDGDIQAEEMKSLANMNIESILLNHRKVFEEDNGNYVIASGGYIRDGHIGMAGSLDLVSDNRYSIYADNIEINKLASYLPFMWGYGDVPSTHVALTLDENFLDIASSKLLNTTISNGFINVDEFLYYWTGLYKVHQEYGITREPSQLTIGDKVWMIERFNSEYTFTAKIEEAYKRKTNDALINIWTASGRVDLDTDTNAALYDRLSNYYGERLAVYSLQTQMVDGISYNLHTDEISINMHKFEESLINQFSSLDVEDLQNIFSHVRNIWTPEIDTLFLDEKYRTYYILLRGSTHIGSDSDDSLRVSHNNGNIFVGDKGNDNLTGSYGEDLYLFNRGDGQDTIFEYGGFNDRIVFGKGITLSDITLKILNDYGPYNSTFIIALKEDGKTFDELQDKLTIRNFLYTPFTYQHNKMIEKFEFADGTVIDLKTIISQAGTDGNDKVNWTFSPVNINLGDGDDSIEVASFDNVLAGGKGNDSLRSGQGNDTFIFNRGDGIDIISDMGGRLDKIIFGEGIDLENIVVKLVGNDLIIALNEVGKAFEALQDKITIQNYINSSSFSSGAIEQFVFANGMVVDISSIISRACSDGNDSLVWSYSPLSINLGNGNDIITAGNFDNMLAGGKGNDTLRGGSKSDIFIFNRGDGQDTITDTGGEHDSIKFGEGIAFEDLELQINGTQMVIALKEDGKSFEQLSDKITINNYYISSSLVTGTGKIERLVFADGSIHIMSNIFTSDGTPINVNITSMDAPINIATGNGNDIITAGNFNNTITGGKGSDYIRSGTGNDTFYFNRGDGSDIILDAGGNDKIMFGEGITLDDILVDIFGNDDISIGLKETGKTFAQLTDKITIKNYKNHLNEFGTGTIELFELADGASVNIDSIINSLATAGSDDISWSLTPLDINMGDGSDTLTTGNFDNIITGGNVMTPYSQAQILVV